MEKNYRKLNVVFGRKDNYSRLAMGNDSQTGLSYDRHKLSIGFDYNACDPERSYIFAVTRWMSLQIGKHWKHKSLPEVPTILYDGGHSADDRWPVLVKSTWSKKAPKDWDWCLTDSIGFKTVGEGFKGVPAYDGATPAGKKKFIKTMSLNMKALSGYSYEEQDVILLKELKRLNRFWRAYVD